MPLEILHCAAPCRNVPVTFTLELTNTMDYCYVKFTPKDEGSFRRLTEFFAKVKEWKEGAASVDEDILAALLTDQERSYFWQPTPEELAEWNQFWFSTPLPQRHSADMPMPQWDFGSMLDAFRNGEYTMLGVQMSDGTGLLTFNPYSYPYGGAQSFVAMVESFGHRVIGVEDGTGYVEHEARKTWNPRRGR